MKKNATELANKLMTEHQITTFKTLCSRFKLKTEEVELLNLYLQFQNTHHYNMGHDEGQEELKRQLQDLIKPTEI